MKPHRTPPLDEAAIDALYGLEPVIDPAREGVEQVKSGAQSQFLTVECPYCGEPFETLIDTSAGSTSYIEDCHICCRPIEMNLEVGMEGELNSLTPQRSD
jgi:hypothetical protein